jgi:hypothetical protein
VGDVSGVEGDGAAVGDDHAENHSEGCGLAGTISAEQSDDLLLSEDEADFIDHAPAVVAFDQFGGFEKIHSEFVNKVLIMLD